MSDVTIVALFDRYSSATEAVRDLIQAGIPSDRISALANTMTGDHPALSTNPVYGREEQDTKDQSQPGFVTGAEFGLGLGSMLGVLAGTGSILIPGIGPLIAAGTLATIAAGAATGGVLGGLIGALTAHGVTDNDAKLYAEGLKRGGTLVTVLASDDAAAPIDAIFKRCAAVDIEKRSADWTAEGWVSFDTAGGPMSSAELAAQAETHRHEAGDEHHHAHHHFPSEKPAPLNSGATNETTHYAEDELRQ
jgi:hypothetical protein